MKFTSFVAFHPCNLSPHCCQLAKDKHNRNLLILIEIPEENGFQLITKPRMPSSLPPKPTCWTPECKVYGRLPQDFYHPQPSRPPILEDWAISNFQKNAGGKTNSIPEASHMSIPSDISQPYNIHAIYWASLEIFNMYFVLMWYPFGHDTGIIHSMPLN